MSNLVLRSISGILYAAVLLFSLQNVFSFMLVFSIVTMLAVWEFCSLMNKHVSCHINKLVTVTASGYLFLSTTLFHIAGASSLWFVPYLFCILYLLISELYRGAQKPIANWGYALASQLYIALPLSLLNVLAFHKEGISSCSAYQPVFLLALLIFLWLNDTGAYLVGSRCSKYLPYKLFPSISPNKSWVGSAGGCLFVVIATLVFASYSDLLSTSGWIGMGLTVVVFGTWGDLVESQIKRSIGVKDSGSFLPGHGGILDRFDSLILAAPAAALFLSLLRNM